MSTDKYTSPLSERYASKEMQYIFSPDKKFKTWRKLWIALAEAENELGLKNEQGGPAVTTEQIEELKAHAEDINYDVAKEREKLVRHDVMSHVYAYGHTGDQMTLDGPQIKDQQILLPLAVILNRICLWTAVSESSRNYSFGSNFLLCRRQYGRYYYDRGVTACEK